MVETYFGFKKIPFSDNPDAKQLFASEAWSDLSCIPSSRRRTAAPCYPIAVAILVGALVWQPQPDVHRRTRTRRHRTRRGWPRPARTRDKRKVFGQGGRNPRHLLTAGCAGDADAGPVEDLFGAGGRRFLQRCELPEPWRSSVAASLYLIDVLEEQIDGIERELRRLSQPRVTNCSIPSTVRPFSPRRSMTNSHGGGWGIYCPAL